MTINDVAAHLNMSKSQIRYYEKVGLITVPRNDSGYRIFDEDTMFKLKLINDLKDLDLDLQNINHIIQLYDQPISDTCNKQSNKFIENLITKIEQRLKQQQLILQKIKTLHQLSKHGQYEQNQHKIFAELAKEVSMND